MGTKICHNALQTVRNHSAMSRLLPNGCPVARRSYDLLAGDYTFKQGVSLLQGCLKLMILMAMACTPTSNERTTKFSAHFALLKWKRKMCVCLHYTKKILPIKVNKQALFWKFETQTNRLLRCMNQVSSICFLI